MVLRHGYYRLPIGKVMQVTPRNRANSGHNSLGIWISAQEDQSRLERVLI